MKKDILVIGLGTFGYALAIKLYKSGHHVMAVEKDEHLVNKIKDDVTVSIAADVTDPDVLKQIDPNAFDIIVLGRSSNLELAVLTLAQLKNMKVKYIIAKANSFLQREILLKLGADEVILAEEEMAKRIANRITHPNIKEVFDFNTDISLMTVKVPKRLVGKTIKELDLRKKNSITVFMRKQGDKTELINDPNIKFEEDDELFVAGNEANILKIFDRD
jgi:trk system potassium uptake protein TrkA